MIFEFTVHPTFNFLTSFAEKLEVPVDKNRLIIPPFLGRGYVKKIDVDADLRFVMHHYTLNQTFQLRRLGNMEKDDLISNVFNSHEIPSDHTHAQESTIQFLKQTVPPFKLHPVLLPLKVFFRLILKSILQ